MSPALKPFFPLKMFMFCLSLMFWLALAAWVSVHILPWFLGSTRYQWDMPVTCLDGFAAGCHLGKRLSTSSNAGIFKSIWWRSDGGLTVSTVTLEWIEHMGFCFKKTAHGYGIFCVSHVHFYICFKMISYMNGCCTFRDCGIRGSRCRRKDTDRNNMK